MKKRLKRLFKKPNWYNLRNLEPISKVFGLDSGGVRGYLTTIILNNIKLLKVQKKSKIYIRRDKYEFHKTNKDKKLLFHKR